jgi:hypothetical protein
MPPLIKLESHTIFGSRFEAETYLPTRRFVRENNSVTPRASGVALTPIAGNLPNTLAGVFALV